VEIRSSHHPHRTVRSSNSSRASAAVAVAVAVAVSVAVIDEVGLSREKGSGRVVARCGTVANGMVWLNLWPVQMSHGWVDYQRKHDPRILQHSNTPTLEHSNTL